jgi:signal transduction histidine kinase
VQYANLSTGKYAVQLKAASANGVMAPNIITIPFEIAPPFWKRAWFIGLLSIAAITIFGLIIRYISQRNLKEKLLLLEKEQAVEKERNRISRDMHDDLGSGLTKIAIMSEVVKKQIHEPEKARQQLENISQSSRELVDNLQDIIWVLNPKNDTLESLAAYIREYALKFFEPFETDLEFNYPEKFPLVKLSEETRRNIFLVAKESFNNIAKHAWCDKVNISIAYNPALLKLMIRDDGKGFDPVEVRLFGNGLINMQSRVEQIGGKYEVESKKGEGTITRIIIGV